MAWLLLIDYVQPHTYSAEFKGMFSDKTVFNGARDSFRGTWWVHATPEQEPTWIEVYGIYTAVAIIVLIILVAGIVYFTRRRK